MQLIKKIFYSILILAGIGVMVVLFMFAIMMIFHVSIFGYTYSSVNDKYSDLIPYSKDLVNSIEIETGSANINFYYTQDSGDQNVSVRLFESFQGIVKDDVKTCTLTVEDPDENGVVKISTTEPNGLFFRNSTTVYISLPNSKIFENISIKTNSENVSFGNNNTFEVNNLNITSTKKSLTPGVTLGSNLKVNDSLSLETFAGRINVNAQILGDVNIKTNIGTIIFNNSINGDVTISGENPNIEFGEVPNSFIKSVKAGNDYDSSRLKQVNIDGDLIIDEVINGGNIKISGTVDGFLHMRSPNMQLWANKINKGMICDKGSNEIIIFGSLGQSNPNEQNTLKVGKFLLINEPYAILDITADKNGVEIRNAHNNVTVVNKNMDTKVDFADDADDKTLTVLQENGNIIANNIKGKATLIATNGNVGATFQKISQDNQIKAKYNASIKIKDGLVYKLITKSYASTNINVDLGSVQIKDWSLDTSDENYKQITQNVPKGTTSSNELSVFVTERGIISISFI